MARDNEAQQILTADVSQYSAQMEAAAQSATAAAQKMQNAFRESTAQMAQQMGQFHAQVGGVIDKIASSFGKVTTVMAAAAAAIAGGAAFKSAVEESVKLTKEAGGLAKAFGITTTEASILNVAIGDLYISSETLLGANDKLVRGLRENEEGFTKLGVATRDQNGNFRSSLDIMLDVNQRLLSFKEGIDRNIEGQKIYGKSWSDVSGVLKLTADAMVESKAKAEELGLIVGKENVEATARYRAAMNDVGDVLTAMKKAVGDALLPVLTQLGTWFAEIGPAAVTAMKGAIGGITSLFWGLKTAVDIVWGGIMVAFTSIVQTALTVGDVVGRALKGDFSGVKAAWQDGMRQLNSMIEDQMNDMEGKIKANRDKIAALFLPPTETAAKTGGQHSEGGEPKEKKSRMAEFEAQLAARRDAFEREKLEQGSFQEFSKQQERDFWKNILQTVTLSTEERAQVSRKYYAVEKDIRKAAFETEIADLKSQIEAHRQGSVERIQISGEAAARIAERFGMESKEYKTAAADMLQMARERAKEEEKLQDIAIDRARTHQDYILQLELEKNAMLREMGEITKAEEIRRAQEVEEKKFQIELKAAQDRAALMPDNSPEKATALAAIEKAQEQHNLRMMQLSRQLRVSMAEDYSQWVDPVVNAFGKAAKGIIQHTQTISQATRGILKSMAQDYISTGIKILAEHVKNKLLELLITQKTASAGTAAASSAADQTIAKKGLEATGVITANAGEAASGAAASQAAIPFVGPALAVAAAAAIMSFVMGMKGGIASAAGGFDIPAGVNPMTQLHEREMVLPAHLADAVRGMAAQGGPTVGGGDMHVHISAMDSKDVHRALMQGGALHKAIKQLHRSFAGQ